MSYEYAITYASALVFCIGCSAMLSNIDLFTAMRNAMKIRVAICSLIYRKVRRIHDFLFCKVNSIKSFANFNEFPLKIVAAIVKRSIW